MAQFFINLLKIPASVNKKSSTVKEQAPSFKVQEFKVIRTMFKVQGHKNDVQRSMVQCSNSGRAEARPNIK